MNPRKYIGVSHCASSVYLDITPSDNQLTLEWTSSVPWNKDSSVVERKNDLTGMFDSIGIAYSAIYTDTGLINGKTYCYRIKTFGHYTALSIVSPLINYSQITCGIPIDNVAPCAPNLNITANCDSIINYLSWNNPNLSCADDVVKYNLFYNPLNTGDYNLISSFVGANVTNFQHNNNNESIAGCYFITALDSVNNESLHSDTVCVDNCPIYQLPNVFSPNGDQVNDFFKPYPYKFVESIDIKIYNRWGNLIFASTDPEILWDGTIQKTKQPCTDGVYYYICKINTVRLTGIVTETLNGFVQVISTKSNPPN
jgi:gliding motility-associated-like protein